MSSVPEGLGYQSPSGSGQIGSPPLLQRPARELEGLAEHAALPVLLLHEAALLLEGAGCGVEPQTHAVDDPRLVEGALGADFAAHAVLVAVDQHGRLEGVDRDVAAGVAAIAVAVEAAGDDFGGGPEQLQLSESSVAEGQRQLVPGVQFKGGERRLDCALQNHGVLLALKGCPKFYRMPNWLAILNLKGADGLDCWPSFVV